MQTTDIATMSAGRELDALVASTVLGLAVRVMKAVRDAECGDLSVCPFHHPSDGSPPEPWSGCDADEDHPAYQLPDSANPNYWEIVPPLSTDIGAAWQVVEHMRNQRWYAEIHTRPEGWEVDFETARGTGAVFHFAVAETAPLAICRAALLAVPESAASASA